MKILHLADLHLGKNVSGLSMIDFQRHVLTQAIDLCKKENIKNIIISGDVYDRSIPPEDAVNVLNYFLSVAVLDEKIQVYMISGNHDSKERLSCFNGILEKQGLFIDSNINKDLSMTKHTLTDGEVTINLYSLPYIYPAEIRVLSGDDDVRNFEKSVIKVLENNKLNKDEINILNAHYFVTGNEEPIRSDSEVKTSVGLIEQISYRVFDDFDYVALGHLHCPQHIGREMVRYAGSPLRYSVDEIKQNKCFTIIDVKGKNDISIIKADIKPLYAFEEITGTVADLTVDSHIKDERILFFNLTDEKHVINAASRLKEKYPHYIGLKYINIQDDMDGEQVSLAKEEGFEELTTDEQFKKFFTFITERDLDETQLKVVSDVVNELENEGK